MPGVIQNSSQDSLIKLKELHPTFGAEIEDLNLATISDTDFKTVLELMSKVDGIWIT
jgi:hypothetical protein